MPESMRPDLAAAAAIGRRLGGIDDRALPPIGETMTVAEALKAIPYAYWSPPVYWDALYDRLRCVRRDEPEAGENYRMTFMYKPRLPRTVEVRIK